MKDIEIRKLWEEFTKKYKEYFQSNNEFWLNNLKLIEDYMIINKKRPSTRDKNVDIKKLCIWISNQQTNYKKNEKIMKDIEIRKLWEEFTEKYQKYF